MSLYAFLAEYFDRLYSALSQNILVPTGKNLIHVVYYVYALAQMGDTWLLEVHSRRFTLVSYSCFRALFF